MNVLIVDDEKLLVKGLKKSLMLEGFNVFAAYDGKEAFDILERENIEFIILDLMLPEMDGMTLCKKIRQKFDVPILILTAKDDYVDKILGLEAGADDYMTKPFNIKELIARIRAICRRINGSFRKQEILEFDLLKLNILERTLYKGAKEIPLTAKEFDILKLLISNPGVVFSREKLFDLVWNEISCDTRTVDVHISKLRDKIEEDPSNPEYIKTKWGIGYFFKKEKSKCPVD